MFWLLSRTPKVAAARGMLFLSQARKSMMMHHHQQQQQRATITSMIALPPPPPTQPVRCLDVSFLGRIHQPKQKQQQQYQAVSANAARSISTSTKPRYMPLDEFRDSVPRHVRANEPVGRSWSVTELRRKSYQDLHKLWYVLYKERNMLLTEKQLSRRKGIIFPQPERMKKVRKSMGAIKQVLGERKREKLSRLAMEKEIMQDNNKSEETMDDVEEDKMDLEEEKKTVARET